MSIRLKIIIPFFLFLVMLASVCFYILYYTINTRKLIENSIGNAQKVYELSNKLNAVRFEIQTNLLSYRYNRDKSLIRVINVNEEETDRLVPEMKKYLTSAKGRELLREFTDSEVPLRKARTEFINAIDRNEETDINKYFGIWKIHASNTEAAFKDLLTYNFHAFERSELLYSDLGEKIYYLTIFLIVSSIILIILLYAYISEKITRPVQAISRAAGEISRGNFAASLHYNTRDEIGNLAADLNKMSVKLREYYAGLEDKVRRQKELIRKNREFEIQKDDFLNIASHELKTPLTSLKILGSLLKKMADKNGDREYARYASKMDSQITRLNSLIADLLDVTKAKSGEIPLTLKSVDINSLVRETAEFFELSERKHKVRIQGRLRRKVQADAERITQVMNNLIGNAVKYSPDSGDVIVTLEDKGGSVRVSVRDFGIGIDKRHHKKIFGRFYRVNDREGISYPGLGIGLYLSSEIIRRHHGKIWVESEKGKGSVFSFMIPYRYRKK